MRDIYSFTLSSLFTQLALNRKFALCDLTYAQTTPPLRKTRRRGFSGGGGGGDLSQVMCDLT